MKGFPRRYFINLTFGGIPSLTPFWLGNPFGNFHPESAEIVLPAIRSLSFRPLVTAIVFVVKKLGSGRGTIVDVVLRVCLSTKPLDVQSASRQNSVWIRSTQSDVRHKNRRPASWRRTDHDEIIDNGAKRFFRRGSSPSSRRGSSPFLSLVMSYMASIESVLAEFPSRRV